MRVAFLLLALLLSSGARANDDAVMDYHRAAHALEDERIYDAAVLYFQAIKKGIPHQYLATAEVGFCVTRLWIQVDKRTFEACKHALRHSGSDGSANVGPLAYMLSSMATILVRTEHYEATRWVIEEFDHRYRNRESTDLFVEQQRVDIAKAEILRVSGKPREAAELIELIIKEGYQPPEGATRAYNEVDVLELHKILLFAAADLRDEVKMRDALERFDRAILKLRSAEGLEYGSVLMMCGAHIIATRIGIKTRKLFGEMLDRTAVSMGLLLKSHEKNRQRQLLMPYITLVQECGPSNFYTVLSDLTLQAVRHKGAGEKEFKDAFDHYKAGRYSETGAGIDNLVAALRNHPDTLTDTSIYYLELLRKYLLDPPGRVLPG